MHCIRRLIVQTLVFSHSYLHHQVSPPENLVVKGGTTWAKTGRRILPENARIPRNIQGSFTCRKSTTWDKRLYFPSEGRRAEDFFALKNRTASAGFKPTNLSTKGQHATSRPSKPLRKDVRIRDYFSKPKGVLEQKRLGNTVFDRTATGIGDQAHVFKHLFHKRMAYIINYSFIFEPDGLTGKILVQFAGFQVQFRLTAGYRFFSSPLTLPTTTSPTLKNL